jgi:hypothetical protein
MTLCRRRLLTGLLSATPIAGAARTAGAVIIQDSTWRAEGGRPDDGVAGFRAHIALANQQQFDSLIALSEDGGDSWDDCSATWLGNFGGKAWVLTAAHVFKKGEKANTYLYRTQGGTIFEGLREIVNPRYQGDSQNRGGYDVALIQLDGPVSDAGPPPLLYSGEMRVGTRIVFVGFGQRGIGSQGEVRDYGEPQDNKTAAENTIDKVTEPTDHDEEDEDSGNELRVTLRRPNDGGARMDGILGGGDSGGSAWMRSNGRWHVIGVNCSGGEKYEDHAYFARLTGVRPWLLRYLPGLRFVA